jgi:hypothetical protein
MKVTYKVICANLLLIICNLSGKKGEERIEKSNSNYSYAACVSYVDCASLCGYDKD